MSDPPIQLVRVLDRSRRGGAARRFAKPAILALVVVGVLIVAWPSLRAPEPHRLPAIGPTPIGTPEPQVDCHGESGPMPSMLADDPCPDAILAVEAAVAPVGLPVDRIVLEPGPFYCDLIWPGGQSAGPCFGPMVRPGQYMHGWVWFRGSDQVAAVMLGLDLPDDLDQPGATRPPWHATLVATEVPPAGFVVQ